MNLLHLQSLMSSLEWNKIFAAVLVAGITAKLAGFAADKIVHPNPPEEAVIAIDTSAVDMPTAAGDTGPEPVEPILGLLADADIVRGEKISRACRACHTFESGGPNLVGPNLYDIVGADLGHIDDFAYSDALMEKAAEVPQWTYEALNEFMKKPKDYIPGTKMNYIGLKKPEDRAALIGWMRTLSESPKDLPTEIEIQARQDAYDALIAPPEPEGAADQGDGEMPENGNEVTSETEKADNETGIENASSTPESENMEGTPAIPSTDE